MKVAVIGAGIAGLTLAWALVRRGVRVEVLDQGPIPNPTSSSFDEHRVMRQAYGPLKGYGRLMPAAYAAWDRLWADLGSYHFVETGSIFTFRGDDAWLKASLEVMQETGALFRPLPLDVLAERAPMLRLDGVTAAIETAGDGMLLNTRILNDLVVHLAAHGVGLRPHTRILDVDPHAGRIRLAAGVEDADVVIVAAGAWVGRLVSDLSAQVRPSRQAVLYLAPPARLAEAYETSPILVDFNGDEGIYVIPPRDGTRLKVGDHVFTLSGDPDDDRSATAADLARLEAAIEAAFVDPAAYTVLERKVCYYTVRPDETFLADRLGPRGWVVSACSGHGFKFAPLVAEMVADGVTGARPADDVTAMVAGRGENIQGL